MHHMVAATLVGIVRIVTWALPVWHETLAEHDRPRVGDGQPPVTSTLVGLIPAGAGSAQKPHLTTGA
jgi:hypothetical protein